MTPAPSIPKDDKNPWQTVSSKIMYQNPWLTVREDAIIKPGGAPGIYGVVEGGDGVFIIAETAAREVYLIETFRYPTPGWCWELVAGGIDAGDSPLAAAKKELLEEAGIEAEEWTEIGTSSPSFGGWLTDTQHVFVARNLRVGAHHREPGEAIRDLRAFPIDEVFAMVKSGRLRDGQTLAALLHYKLWLEAGGDNAPVD